MCGIWKICAVKKKQHNRKFVKKKKAGTDRKLTKTTESASQFL